MGMAEQRAGYRQPLFLAARHLDPALADDRVEPAIRPREQVVARRLLQDAEALRVRGRRVHEEQVLPDRSREELRILGDETDLRAQIVEVGFGARRSVVEDAAR